jgi:acyl-coenzyme A thioesterase PaaI-like protein
MALFCAHTIVEPRGKTVNPQQRIFHQSGLRPMTCGHRVITLDMSVHYMRKGSQSAFTASGRWADTDHS